MPWVNIVTGCSIPKDRRAETAEGISRTLNEVIGKDPAGVFVSFTRADDFYWGGSPRDDAAIFDLRWIGEFSADQKREISRRICGVIGPAAGLEAARTRVVFTSKAGEDWGRFTP